MNKTRLAALAGALFVSSFASAQQLSELMINPTGADTNREFIELKSTPGFSYNNYFLLEIDGDLSVAGRINKTVLLTGLTAGSNGLLLIKKAVTNFLPTASGATTILNLPVGDPDFHNSSTTFILCAGTPPVATTDFDAANNGSFNIALLGTATIADAVSIEDNDVGNNFGYADNLGFKNFPAGTYMPDMLYRVNNSGLTAFLGWTAMDVLIDAGGAASGPYLPFQAANFTSDVPGFTFANFTNMNPGNINDGFSGAVTLAVTLNVGGYAGDFTGRGADVVYTDSASVNHSFLNQAISITGVVNVTLPGSAALGAGTLRVKMSHSLTKQDSFTLVAGANTFTSSQLNGDVNDDDFVGFDDFDILSASFNLSMGDSGYVDLADLNGDMFVGFDDFDILSANFNTSGD